MAEAAIIVIATLGSGALVLSGVVSILRRRGRPQGLLREKALTETPHAERALLGGGDRGATGDAKPELAPRQLSSDRKDRLIAALQSGDQNAISSVVDEYIEAG